MLSIGAMGAGQEDYYLGLAREDYYLEGGEPPGRWVGQGTQALGLAGDVEPEALRNLFRGVAPDGSGPLIQNAGDKDHQPGWDLTFSAPKSVSTLWAVADEGTRHLIQSIHDEAVRRALGYLEEEATFTRRGKGGQEREPAQLIAALFPHGTSRLQDPQLHTHALVLNVAVRRDGTTGTIESKPFYLAKMTAGALYRAELASLLEQRLGLAVERHRTWFEVTGVPRSLMTEFSRRRAEIEEFLEARGSWSPQAATFAALSTREVKGHVARGELFDRWRSLGADYEFGPEEAEALLDQPPPQDREARKQAILDVALERITAQQSHFGRAQLVRVVAEEAQGLGLGASEVLARVTDALANLPEVVSLGQVGGEVRYTTREMLALERQLLADAHAMKGDTRHQVPTDQVTAALAGRPDMKSQQVEALRHVTERAGGVQVVVGMPGTGKTYMLAAAREAWESAGLRVVGAALSGKAADGLQQAAGFSSNTLAKCLMDLGADEPKPVQQREKESRPPRQPRTGARPDRFRLDDRTVWVVDEAGMVGTRQMARVVAFAREAGAKLVLVGDPKQLQPIEAGGPFKALAQALGAAQLSEILRQQGWAQQAVYDFADGRTADGLRAFAEQGLVTITKDRRAAVEQIAADWLAAGDNESRLILTGTNGEAAAINRIIQQERAAAGELGRAALLSDGRTVREHDRLLFTRNSRLYGVKNGTLATLERVDGEGHLQVRLDSGEYRTIPTAHYPHVQLGYAVTTHRAQGTTASRVYVLAGGPMEDRELAFVKISRASAETRLYIEQAAAGDTIALLAKQMNVSHLKELAVAVASPEALEAVDAKARPAPEI